jgi:hypothetical protein
MTHDAAVLKAREIASRVLAPSAGQNIFGSFLPSLWLVGTTKAYSGLGADIVMESITLTTHLEAALGGGSKVRRTKEGSYRRFAYSALASFRMGMSGSASFQRAKKSW